MRFSHTVCSDVPIDEHTVASQLPKPTLEDPYPSLQAGCAVFRSLAAGDGAPETIKDYFYSDDPQLALHVTSFADATVMGLSFSHATTDALGLRAIVRGVSLILAGREAEVPSLADADVLRELETNTSPEAGEEEPYVLADERMGKWSYYLMLLRYLIEGLRAGREETHMMFLPARYMAYLRKSAEASLSPPEGSAFVSDGDILTAWGAQMVMSVESQPRPAIVANTFDMRGRLSAFDQSRGVYVQNMVLPSTTCLSASDVENGNLGQMALKVRENIKRQVDERQIRAYMREYRAANMPLTGPLYGDPASKLVSVHNWTRARFFEAVDFGPAVKSASDGSETDQRVRPPHVVGRPVYQHSQVLRPGRITMNVFHIYGKDAQGNYWVHGTLHPVVWTKIREHLDSVKTCF